jgi:hypothetical protein
MRVYRAENLFILDQISFLPTHVFVVQFKAKRDSSLRRPTRSPRKNLRGKQEANGKENSASSVRNDGYERGRLRGTCELAQ